MKQEYSGGKNGGNVRMYMYLGTYTIFSRPLVKVTSVLLKLNDLLKKLGV